MWQGVSDRLIAASHESHTVYSYAEVWRGAVKMGEIQLVGGTVDVDEDAQVRRTLSLELADIALDPVEATDLLSPFGSKLHVFSGIQFPEGDVETVPMGVFGVDNAGRSSWFGRVAVQASDSTRDVFEYPFITAYSVPSGTRVVDQIAVILNDVDPDFVLVDYTASEALAKKAVYEDDRWPAIEQLAAGIGAECFFDQQGTPILRDVPSISDTPDWTVTGGEEGNLVNVATALARDDFYNGVVVVNQPQGDEQPITAVAYQRTGDLRWGGPAGKKLRRYSSPFILTVEQARSAAGAILARSVAFARKIAPEVLRNPAADVGDTVRVVLPDGRTYDRIAKKLSIPLGRGTMTVETRVAADAAFADELGGL